MEVLLISIDRENCLGRGHFGLLLEMTDQFEFSFSNSGLSGFKSCRKDSNEEQVIHYF